MLENKQTASLGLWCWKTIVQNGIPAILLLASVMMGIAGAFSIDDHVAAQKTERNVLDETKATHSPIHITTNGEFTAANGVTGGSGTPADPYIIENWVIDAYGGSYCIWIENTNAHFVIRNCTVMNATNTGALPYACGIALVNARNGILQGNNATNNHIGMLLQASTNLNIADNVVYESNYYSIALDSSTNTTITNNTITAQLFGIFLRLSTNITVSSNNISVLYTGIGLLGTENVTVSSNSMWNTGLFVFGNTLAQWNTHEIETTNAVNGKPVYYYKNQNGGSAPSDAGQIILANCTNMTISSLLLSNTFAGIQLGFSSNNTITSNTISLCPYGITLQFSSENTISANELNTTGYGVALEYSSKTNTVANNSISNTRYGIYAYLAENNIISGNNAFSNSYSIYLWVSENNTITNNNLSNNHHGLYLYYGSHNNSILHNTILASGSEGIYMHCTNSNHLTGNKMENCGILVYGYDVVNWNSHEIDTTNTVNGKPVLYHKNQNGGTVQVNAGQVILANCTNMTIADLNISNASAGIQLGFSGYNTVTGNALTGNSLYGIYLWYATHNTLSNNSATASMSGFYLQNGDANAILNNNASANTCGIHLETSNSNQIKYNWLCENKEYGICLKNYSGSNYILHNYFIANNGAVKGLTGNCQAYDDAGGNIWYSNTLREGNYWSNWDGNGWGTPDAYPIDGGAGASDWYPLSNPVSESCNFLPLLLAIGILPALLFPRAWIVFKSRKRTETQGVLI
ncbi:MAG: right-handed parallel beta-helix repeat-containing protein [Thermoplasmata archaeon]|nr:right-handed parallel beta-helix repeat-containing protein [Thermoplasmata archaeon]